MEKELWFIKREEIKTQIYKSTGDLEDELNGMDFICMEIM